jgi:predicted alpha/beta-fold hydrolase
MSRTLHNELSTKQNKGITKTELKQIKEMTSKQASGSGFVADLNQNIESKTIKQVECPTLILHSENDKSVPIEMAFYADKEINSSVLKTFNNKWGHLLWVGEDSKYPIAELNEFLKENASY